MVINLICGSIFLNGRKKKPLLSLNFEIEDIMDLDKVDGQIRAIAHHKFNLENEG